MGTKYSGKRREMRLRSITAAAGIVLAAAVAFVGCNGPAPESAATKPEQAVPAVDPQLATAAYRCPMGCQGSVSAKPGKCPVCEMTLERNPDYKPAPDSL